MKKRSILVAVGSVLAAYAGISAQATSMTMFGSAQVEYTTVDIEGITSQANVSDDAGRSKWGVQVVENLANGLSAKAHLEFGFSPGTGGIGIARERWVALAGNQWGELKFGRVQSPFKDFAGGITIDPFAYTTLQAGGSGGTMVASANGLGAASNGFVNSAVRYDSPTVEGFTFSALLMPGDSNRLDPLFGAGNNANSGGEDGEWDFQIAGKYDAQIAEHNIGVFGGYSRDNVSSVQRSVLPGVVDDEEVWRGGASWQFQNFRLSGQYENVNNAVGAATCTNSAMLGALGNSRAQCNSAMNVNGDGDLWFVGGEYALGNTRLIAQGGMAYAKATAFAAKRDVSSFTVGAIHHLSKRSSLFGGYQRVMIDDRQIAVADSDSNKYTVGMRHDF